MRGILFIMYIFVLLIGFAAGRRIGIKQGFEIGIRYAPIELKKQMFESGLCPVCNISIDSLKSL
ncbi:MAG: hypothetical protein PWQ82_1390 [Thermosediminibacterales bacterium]|nr:hypothetical protein [Thermosediminibacterales bacterium]